jgi:uncharacterized caspase-like protein
MNRKFNLLHCFLTLTLSLCFGTLSHAARLALVIGNDAYKQVEPLKNARNDARLMAGVLKKAGFEINIASDLTRDGLWSAIDTFKGRIQKGDEVAFYFAGHGVQINSNQLLLPVDIAAKTDAQVQRDGVPLIDIQDALKDARFALLLIDACRDNPFPKAGTRGIGGTRGLERAEPSTGQIIMMSAGRNQKALDRVPGESSANGLFTWELAQVLQTPGIEIRTALEQVKDRVDDKAKRAGHEQRPSLVNDLKGNFYLVPGEPAQVASVRVEPVFIPQPATANATTQSRDPENALWGEVAKTNNQDDYEAYLTQYPHGKYAGLAKLRIKKLQDETNALADQLEADTWKAAEAAGNEASYQSYLNKFPNGSHLTQAVEGLAAMRKVKAEIEAAKAAGPAKVNIHRSKGLVGAIDTISLQLDGAKIGEISNGGDMNFDVPAGTHSVVVMSSFFGLKADLCKTQMTVQAGTTYRYLLDIDPCRLWLQN